MDAASCRGLVFSDEGKRLEVAFGTSGPVLLALVNARTQDQTLGEARRARLRRVHGVMIRHQMRKDSEFFRTYEMAHHCNPGTWIGLNFSDMRLFQQLRHLPPSASALWTTGIQGMPRDEPAARLMRESWEKKSEARKQLWFSGLPSPDRPHYLHDQVYAARSFVDVLTLPGDDLELIRRVRNQDRSLPIGIISGVSCETAPELLGAGADMLFAETNILMTANVAGLSEEGLALLVDMIRTSGD